MKVTIATTLLEHEVDDVKSNLETAIATSGIPGCEYRLGINQAGEGYVAGINKAIEQIDDDSYICLLNSDSVPLTDDWLYTLIQEMERRQALNVWFAGPSGGCKTAPQNSGRHNDKRRPRLVKHVSGFCMLVHPHVVSAIGLMDESYIHYAGEIDWQWEAIRQFNVRALWVPEVFVSHAVHQAHQDWWEHDHKLLNEKWNN